MLEDGFGAVPRDELQNGAMFAELGAEGIELRRIREAGRNGPSLTVLVEQRERQTVYAGLQRDLQLRDHRRDFLLRGRTLPGGVAHHPDANLRVADEGHHVEPERRAIERPRVILILLPVPGNAAVEQIARHVLDIAEGIDMRFAVLLSDGCQPERAVADSS